MTKKSDFTAEWDEYFRQLDEMPNDAERQALEDGFCDASLDYEFGHCGLPAGPLRVAWHQGHAMWHSLFGDVVPDQ